MKKDSLTIVTGRGNSSVNGYVQRGTASSLGGGCCPIANFNTHIFIMDLYSFTIQIKPQTINIHTKEKL